MIKQIHITTGDTDGIGLEVALKALKKTGPVRNIQFILWEGKKQNPLLRTNDYLTNKFKIIPINNFKDINKNKKNSNTLININSPLKPTEWVVQAAKHCFVEKKTTALVTGPLSKIQMQKDGFNEKGHTELLKKLSNTQQVFMVFLGDSFNVALLTGHIPLKEITLNEKTLDTCLQYCHTFIKNTLSSEEKNKPLGLLGLNPHAGEEGLIGKEEFLFKNLLLKWKGKVEGPLVPDVAFLKSNWKKYSMYVCLYHDQALIPFKMIHERESLQLSLGLPFIRTSVSHGTAKDIFGQDKADPTSMIYALNWTIENLNQQEN